MHKAAIHAGNRGPVASGMVAPSTREGADTSLGLALAVAASVMLLSVAAGARVVALPSAIVVVIALAIAGAIGWFDPRLPVERHATAIAAALVSFPVFFVLRTNQLNTDGNMLTPKFEHDVPLFGAHLTHDELLEFFVHSRVWVYTHRWWGWSVVFSYQVVSCIAGCAFVYVLLRLARRLAPDRTWLFLAGMLSGAYMQLFFGDAENYTITAALAAVYVLASCRFVAGESPLWHPMACLGVAMAFHLETAWLWPSALYLCLLSQQRSGAWLDAGKGGAAGAGVLAAVFVYFHFNGLPLERFFSSHAGHAIRMKDVFAFGMPRTYYADQVKLLLLLCPAIVMIVPAALWSLRNGNETARFITIAAGSMLLLQAVWKSQIGVFEDWNLYALGGLLASMAIWVYASAGAGTRALRTCAAVVVAMSLLQTATWIAANHRSAL